MTRGLEHAWETFSSFPLHFLDHGPHSAMIRCRTPRMPAGQDKKPAPLIQGPPLASPGGKRNKNPPLVPLSTYFISPTYYMCHLHSTERPQLLAILIASSRSRLFQQRPSPDILYQPTQQRPLQEHSSTQTDPVCSRPFFLLPLLFRYDSVYTLSPLIFRGGKANWNGVLIEPIRGYADKLARRTRE